MYHISMGIFVNCKTQTEMELFRQFPKPKFPMNPDDLRKNGSNLKPEEMFFLFRKHTMDFFYRWTFYWFIVYMDPLATYLLASVPSILT